MTGLPLSAHVAAVARILRPGARLEVIRNDQPFANRVSVFQDRALTVPLDQPFTADQDGLIPGFVAEDLRSVGVLIGYPPTNSMSWTSGDWAPAAATSLPD